MKRLPRKRKKQVKKIVDRKYASKMVMTAMVTAQAYAAMIASTPIPYFGPTGIADKAVSAAKVVVDAAQSINKIMSEPPNSWREFIR